MKWNEKKWEESKHFRINPWNIQYENFSKVVLPQIRPQKKTWKKFSRIILLRKVICFIPYSETLLKNWDSLEFLNFLNPTSRSCSLVLDLLIFSSNYFRQRRQNNQKTNIVTKDFREIKKPPLWKNYNLIIALSTKSSWNPTKLKLFILPALNS